MNKKLNNEFWWVVYLTGLWFLLSSLVQWAEVDYYAYDMLFGPDVKWVEDIQYQMVDGPEDSPVEDAWSPDHPVQIGQWWMDSQITLDQSFEEPGLFVSVTGSYELFWDDTKIAANGVLGKSKADEQEGSLIRVFAIPKDLATPGAHRIRLHVSNYHLANSRLQPVVILAGELHDLVRNPLRMTALVYTFAGLFLLAGGYFLVIYLIGERRDSFLIFSLIALFMFLLAVMEFIKYCFDFPYSFHLIRLEIIYVITSVIAILLPLFCTSHFQFNHRRKIVAGMAVVAIIIKVFENDWDLSSMKIMLLGIYGAFPLATLALVKRKTGSIEVFCGLACCFLLAISYDFTLFLGFGLLMIAMIISMARAMERQRREHEETRYRSARLQAELLKKQLQPHFLMNTLSSLIAWVEDKPAQGVRFIEALAEELELLNRISGETTIPIEQEIALCRAHLRVMEFRNEASYHFEAEEHITGEIPPAVLHTLVENGLTHMDIIEDQMDFKLETQVGSDLNYIFTVTGTPRKSGEFADGTGLKYIRSRLQESYPNQWTLNHGPTESGWRTEIEILAGGK